MKASVFSQAISSRALVFSILSALFLLNDIKADGQTMPSKSTLKGRSPFRIGGGISAEYATLSAELKQDFTPYGEANFNQSHHMKRNLQIAPFIEIGSFIGDKWYVGHITSWHYSDTKDSSRFFLRGFYSVVGEFKLKSYISSLFKVGYKPWETMMVYGVMGPSYAWWSHKTKQLRRDDPVGSFDVSKNSWGFSLGAGAEFPLGESIAISVDYIHTLYGSTKVRQIIGIGDSDAILGDITRYKEVSKTIRPSHGVLSLKLSYFF